MKSTAAVNVRHNDRDRQRQHVAARLKTAIQARVVMRAQIPVRMLRRVCYWVPKLFCSSTSRLRLPIRACVCALVQFATDPDDHAENVSGVALQHSMTTVALAMTVATGVPRGPRRIV